MPQVRLNTTELLDSFGFFPSGAKVLDYGCGVGPMALYLAHHAITSYDGIDCNRRRLEAAASQPLDSRFTFHHMDIRNSLYNPIGQILPQDAALLFPDGTFTAIIAHSVFTHTESHPAARRLMVEFERVLAPEGLLWTTWFSHPPSQLSKGAERTVYPKEFIELLLRPFTILDSHGGLTNSYHDQWEICARKI